VRCESVVGIQPAVLRWARESLGLHISATRMEFLVPQTWVLELTWIGTYAGALL